MTQQQITLAVLHRRCCSMVNALACLLRCDMTVCVLMSTQDFSAEGVMWQQECSSQTGSMTCYACYGVPIVGMLPVDCQLTTVLGVANHATGAMLFGIRHSKSLGCNYLCTMLQDLLDNVAEDALTHHQTDVQPQKGKDKQQQASALRKQQPLGRQLQQQKADRQIKQSEGVGRNNKQDFGRRNASPGKQLAGRPRIWMC